MSNKEALRGSLIKKDKVILEVLLKDPDVKVDADGIVWIRRTKRPPSGGAVMDSEGFRNSIITTKNKRQLVYYKGYMLSVPRIVYAASMGELDPDKEIVHRDGVSTNNIISNLYQGSDSEGAGRSLRKFNEDQIIVIRNRRNLGDRLINIAKDFGTSTLIISKIVTGETYKEFGGPLSSKSRKESYGPDSHRSKLTREQYDSILEERKNGVSLGKIAAKYPITSSGISRLCKREVARK